MSLKNPVSFIEAARRNGAAIASFNIHDLEMFAAVVETAAEERAPVIIQQTPTAQVHAGAEYIGAMAEAASKMYDIPIALHCDHFTDYDRIVRSIECGYNSVMIDASKLPYDENVALVRRVVEHAHARGVAVEGELGRIGGTEDTMTVDERSATFTDPEEAAAFVAATGIDTLAVAIGTAHGEYKGEPDLDFERLSAIRERVSVPLVLHGASGVPDWQIREALKRGVAKINIATELKIPMANAIKACFAADPSESDPRKYMGAAKKAVKEVVRAKIRLCGANGLADKL